MTMIPLVSFWAKLGSATWPDEYHPVICHLIDVGAVALNLWENVFRRRFRQWLSGRLGLDKDEKACGRWLAFWCGTHDIGKVSPDFQFQGNTCELKRRLTAPEAGFNFAHTGDKQQHGVISTVVLNAELTRGQDWPAVAESVARNVAVAVGGHHGFFPTDWIDICGPLGNEKWATARRELLAQLARLFGVIGAPSPKPTSPDDQSVWMAVAGLTSVADWIGSNQSFFNPVGNPVLLNSSFNLNDYLKHANLQAQKALKELGWLDREHATSPVKFAELFPFITEPRPLQTALVEIIDGMTEPGLLIVEAPMGEGKTEGGWYAAACWDRRGGQGAYVALPTMATSNQMFDRVGAFLGGDAEADTGKKNLMLQHGKAALNDQFEKLKYAARVYDDEKHPSAVVAEKWFAGNKKHGLLAPYGVGTIDQALLAVLQTKHVFVRLFGLAGKCVILDEVHAYDAYMTTLMERLLRWLGALGCPVVLLSATLPRNKRLQLLRAYAGDDLPEPADVPYPRITSVKACRRPDEHAEVEHVAADASRARTVRLGWLDEDSLAEKLRQSLANGGCATVIRNTVGLAQQMYLRLRDTLKEDGITVELFHARFPFGRRMEIENAVLKRFGKHGGSAERNKRVLVATQVVEQSLDLDFDAMFSDVAPVDLVLQRAGRLHRHERGPRPGGVSEPCLWLIEPGEKDGLPDFGRSEYVYAPFVLLRSYMVLKAGETVRMPDDLERFIEQVYGTEPLTIPDGWQTALDQSKEKLKVKQENQQLNALDVSINDPDDSPLEQQSQQLEEDDPEAAKKIQAQTRDSDPIIQLIVVYQLAGQDYLDAVGQEPFNEADVPDVPRVRQLLDNEVTISHYGCFLAYVGRGVPKAWREKGMLRHHRIVRVDGDGKSLPGDFFLRVDHQLGVRFVENERKIKCVTGGMEGCQR
jgi:CRISPR-associated endonuclease/helicase Cas3